MGSPFVKFEIKVMILFVLISSLVLTFISIEKSFAQRDDNSNNNNALGQEGEGNKASQSESSSQESNENSMCVSGDSTSLSCNNLSLENTGGLDIDSSSNEQSLIGKTYIVEGNVANENPFISISKCNSGDSVLSGGYQLHGPHSVQDEVVKNYASSLSSWTVVHTGGDRGFEIQAFALCFDNP